MVLVQSAGAGDPRQEEEGIETPVALQGPTAVNLPGHQGHHGDRRQGGVKEGTQGCRQVAPDRLGPVNKRQKGK
jgi:hypothetical protein